MNKTNEVLQKLVAAEFCQDTDLLRSYMLDARVEISRLNKQVAAASNALKFYADPNNWKGEFLSYEEGYDKPKAWDLGERAIEGLKEINDEM